MSNKIECALNITTFIAWCIFCGILWFGVFYGTILYCIGN